MSRLVIRVAFGVLLASPTAAHAADSTWLLCKGIADKGGGAKSYLAANLLEHRNATGDGRDLDVTLLYGAHVMTGEILGKTGDFMVKPVALQVTEEVDGKRVVIFTGTGRLSSDMKTFTVAGKFDFTFGREPAPQPIMAKLRCEELNDLAIGH
jgi:hypothetical protein